MEPYSIKIFHSLNGRVAANAFQEYHYASLFAEKYDI